MTAVGRKMILATAIVNVDDKKYRDLRLRGGGRGRGRGTTGGRRGSQPRETPAVVPV